MCAAIVEIIPAVPPVACCRMLWISVLVVVLPSVPVTPITVSLREGKILICCREVAHRLLRVFDLHVGYSQIGDLLFAHDCRRAALDGAWDELVSVNRQSFTRDEQTAGLEFGVTLHNRRGDKRLCAARDVDSLWQ
jgi:hypothetical protein